MTTTHDLLRHTDRFFIGGEWVTPSSNAIFDVIDSGTEEHFFSVAGGAGGRYGKGRCCCSCCIRRGTLATYLTHAERAVYLRNEVPVSRSGRAERRREIWPRESGVLQTIAEAAGAGAAETFDFYADCAQASAGSR